MSDITREQFASAVAAAISSVHHLYREVDRLIVGLRDALAEGPNPLSPVRGTQSKAVRDQTRLVVRNEYGALFGPVIPDEEEADEDDEDLEDEAEDEVGSQASRKRTPAEIASDQPLLAIRIAMYDPRKQGAVEPQIQYAVMNDWAVGTGVSTPGQRIVLARSMLRRVPKSLAESGGISKGGRLRTRAAVKRVGAKKGDDRRLSCQLPVGVETLPLYSLDSAEELDRLTQHMKKLWNEALADVPGRSGGEGGTGARA